MHFCVADIILPGSTRPRPRLVWDLSPPEGPLVLNGGVFSEGSGHFGRKKFIFHGEYGKVGV